MARRSSNERHREWLAGRRGNGELRNQRKQTYGALGAKGLDMV